MLRSLTIAVLLTAATATPALAQSAPGEEWSFEVGAGTDNRSKGASKSGNDGYVFGSATWESADGLFYVSPAVETIQAGGSNVEAEVALGYQPEAFGYEFDFNVAYKNRLDANDGYDNDTVEFGANISRAVGPATVAAAELAAQLRAHHCSDGSRADHRADLAGGVVDAGAGPGEARVQVARGDHG